MLGQCLLVVLLFCLNYRLFLLLYVVFANRNSFKWFLFVKKKLNSSAYWDIFICIYFVGDFDSFYIFILIYIYWRNSPCITYRGRKSWHPCLSPHCKYTGANKYPLFTIVGSVIFLCNFNEVYKCIANLIFSIILYRNLCPILSNTFCWSICKI